MDFTAAAPTRAYAVHVDYLSDGERFASETLRIEVISGLDCYAIAYARANDSIYADPRIPALTLAIAITPVDPEDPDDPDPPRPSTAVKPVCPRCGSDDRTCDACARWDIEAHGWALASTQDCQSCSNCGAEGEDFARWVPAGPRSPADIFFWAVIKALPSAAIAQDPDFQRFCLVRQARMGAKDVAAAWSVRADTP